MECQLTVRDNAAVIELNLQGVISHLRVTLDIQPLRGPQTIIPTGLVALQRRKAHAYVYAAGRAMPIDYEITANVSESCRHPLNPQALDGKGDLRIAGIETIAVGRIRAGRSEQ
jgi:hypothetical protein